MRYVIFLAAMALMGCTNTQSKYGWTSLEEVHGNPESGTEKTGPQPEQLGMEHDLMMVHARCAGKAYGLQTSDVSFVPKCERDPILAVLKKYHQPYLDIWQMQLDQNIVVFEQLQNHKISVAEATAKLDAIGVNANNIRDQRLNSDLGDLAVSQPQIVHEPSSATPSSSSQPNAPFHCDTHIDRAGNGSTNCY